MFKISELAKVTSGKFLKFGEGEVRNISIDSRTLKRKDLFIAIKGNRLDGHKFIESAVHNGAAAIIIQDEFEGLSKIKVPVIKVTDTTKALGYIAKAWRQKFDLTVIAVTGSNGKTTAKEMIAQVLSSKYEVLKNPKTENNHIGVPMALLQLRKSHKIAVLELGSNHFGEINYLSGIVRPDIAIITNIGDSHLEYFLSQQGVFSEKVELLRNLSPKGVCIVNRDDKFLGAKIALKPFFEGKIVLSFGIEHASDFRATQVIDKGLKVFFKSGKNDLCLNTFARHNIYNALASIACAKILGIAEKDIQKSLKSFVFPKGRLNIVSFDNIKLIDDSYNANPLSFACALNAFESFPAKGRKILVLADMLELGERERFFHEEAGRLIGRKPIDILVCIGSRAGLAANSAISAGLNKENVFSCKDNFEAEGILRNVLKSEDAVLFKGSRSMKLEEVIQGIKEGFCK